jgi:hypothetical protein
VGSNPIARSNHKAAETAGNVQNRCSRYTARSHCRVSTITHRAKSKLLWTCFAGHKAQARETMTKALSPKILSEIGAVVEAAAKANVLVQVYAEAEKIRQANIAENIALEDIVQEIIIRSADGPGYEADPNDAAAALLGGFTPIVRTVHLR